jgi:ribosomal protein L34E
MRSIDVPPGTVFGRLTVIEETRLPSGDYALLCRCECGKTKAVAGRALRRGDAKSCGCGRIAAPLLPGAVFGRLTVIGEAGRTGPLNRLAMLCQCECGTRTVVLANNLRSGGSKSCGCRGGAPDPTRPLQPGEVPLYGKSARGRVALVDPDDYALVMQYRWHVVEAAPKAPGRRPWGPYAVSRIRQRDGKSRKVPMHALIMGRSFIDHINSNGLDNRKVNMRFATPTQNLGNQRTQETPGKTSRYKGVYWDRRGRGWVAEITDHGISRYLGQFASEEDAAQAYDIAARKVFGEFARLNFNHEPDVIVDARVQAIWVRRTRSERMVERWEKRQPVMHTCVFCGGEYESTGLGRNFYCSKLCRGRWRRRQERERQQEGRLF